MKNSYEITKSLCQTFLQEENGHTIHLFQGAEVLQGLSKGSRSIDEQKILESLILCFLPTSMLLKGKETLGIYLDSAASNFQFKFEVNSDSKFRATYLGQMLEEDILFSGNLRVIKISPPKQTPYQSVIELKEVPLFEAVNEYLRNSQQVNSQIVINTEEKSALMYSLLADSTAEFSPPDFFYRWHKDDNPSQQFLDSFEPSYKKLLSREVAFECNCGKERFEAGIMTVVKTEGIDKVFEGQSEIEVVCDYCFEQFIFEKNNFK